MRDPERAISVRFGDSPALYGWTLPRGTARLLVCFVMADILPFSLSPRIGSLLKFRRMVLVPSLANNNYSGYLQLLTLL
jgi:hypothetical protein